MEYNGKVYAKITLRGKTKYIECTQTVQDLENEIKELKNKIIHTNKCIKTLINAIEFVKSEHNESNIFTEQDVLCYVITEEDILLLKSAIHE